MAEFRPVAERHGVDLQSEFAIDYEHSIFLAIRHTRLNRARGHQMPRRVRRGSTIRIYELLTEKWDILQPEARERELPLMSELMRAYHDSIPDWLRLTIFAKGLL